ncbi:MAG: NAD(P)H-dependent oxidoreductase [Proteobacteria bacterium]|nr:NAD(P)H-dependent oxidoreductase [Pseudomonadota bacterium]
MKHAVILAHPGATSFTGRMARAYEEAVAAKDGSTVLRDLNRIKFNPCLGENEIPWSPRFEVPADVARERELLKDAAVFAFFYPLWLNSPPAILKGYMERVFSMGFAYRRGRGGNEPLLTGRRLVSFSSSGAPMDWINRTGAWQAMRTLFDTHFAAVCGMEIADHIHFGGVIPGVRADFVERCAATVQQKASSL